MKKDDIPFLMDDVKNKMPVYTENTLKVKGNKLPKNMKEYVEKTNRKFLDNHLSNIEEYYHVFPEYNTKVCFRRFFYKKKQSVKYFRTQTNKPVPSYCLLGVEM